MYNETVEKILELEAKGEIFVIRPSAPLDVKVIERDAAKLQAAYDRGIVDCKNAIKALKEYLEK